MRGLADAARVDAFMRELGHRVASPARVYFTGGTSAVLLGWRAATIDVDVKFVPESDEIFRAIPELKERLRLNVELASPDLFLPELPGWRERSRFIRVEGVVSFFHYDFYAQALAKLERGHEKDLGDARRMIEAGLVLPKELVRLFEAIEPHLHRYPAIDPPTLRRAVSAAAGG